MSLLTSKTYLSSLESSLDQVINLGGLKNKSIFITGATGLIGSALVDLLLIANQTRSLNIKIFAGARNLEKCRNRFLPFDDLTILEYDLLKNFTSDLYFDYIVHCASNADPTNFSKYPVETNFGNIFGSYQLLNHLKKQQSGKFLFISSSEVYGNKDNQELYSETDIFPIDFSNLRACYPISKRCSENLCADFNSEYDVDYVIARPGHIYGPTMNSSDSRASSSFIRDASNGQSIVMKSKGEQLRSYCYVLDCATALLSILLAGQFCTAYNISNSKSLATIKEFAETCAAISGQHVTFELPSGSEKASYNLMSCSALNSTRLESLGWHGTRDLATGIQETLQILSELPIQNH
ncbi:MAG: NAD-dependent epimerase/dehydratase family protein [Candidatus Saccharibacteria bacterium]|nr:NAD-dependent epimerase/dehydratase family protein [Candidatus Saccharibacteria bacterium]